MLAPQIIPATGNGSSALSVLLEYPTSIKCMVEPYRLIIDKLALSLVHIDSYLNYTNFLYVLLLQSSQLAISVIIQI